MLSTPEFLENCMQAIKQELDRKGLKYIVRTVFELTAKNSKEYASVSPTICTVFNGEINVSDKLTGVKTAIATVVDFSVVLLVQSNMKDHLQNDYLYLKAIKKALLGKEFENFINIKFAETSIDYIENIRMYMLSFNCHAIEDLND